MQNSTSEQRLSKVFSPIMTVAALSALVAGCSSSAIVQDDDDMMMPSSSMMKSSDAMMSSEGTMMKSTDSMSSEATMMMSSAAQSMLYKDGTYGAGGVYRSPAGGESLEISLTMKNNVVTDATFVGDATHEKSMAMQSAFSSGFKEQVVGKSLNDVSVGVVNGSSLTGIGFMNAVAKIKLEAKA